MKTLTFGLATLWLAGACFSQQTSKIDWIKEKDFEGSSFLLIYEGDYTIPADKVLHADLIVSGGTLIIRGALEGRAVVVDGAVGVEKSAAVNGTITVIDGEVTVRSGTVDLSLIRHTSWQEYTEGVSAVGEMAVCEEALPELPKEVDSTLDLESFKRELKDLRQELEAVHRDLPRDPDISIHMDRSQKKWRSADENTDDADESDESMQEDEVEDLRKPNRADLLSTEYRYRRLKEYDDSPVAFDYNRVDGLFLGAKVDRAHSMFRFKPLRLYGQVGYAFNEKAVRFQGGLDRFWGRAYRFEVGAEVHDLTSSEDYWRIGHAENVFNALLFKRDYWDYFRAQGFSVHASQNLNRNLKLTAAFRRDRYRSLDLNTKWAVFFPREEFRDNPPVDEGFMNSLVFQAELENVRIARSARKHAKRVGWRLAGEVEHSGAALGSDFRFTRYRVDVTRYQPLSRWENLDFRLMLGSATGDLPLQKTMYVGGVSTLRAHDYKEFGGNHMALLNVEYRLSSGRFSRDRIFVLDPFSIILFADAGTAWSRPIDSYTELFSGFDSERIETDIGVGLGDEKDLFRFDIARNVSRKNGDYRLSFRINYAF